MAKRRERVRQCRQIRELIQENKYTKALELIDELPLDEVGSLDDFEDLLQSVLELVVFHLLLIPVP